MSENIISLIEKTIKSNKPDGVYSIELEITPSHHDSNTGKTRYKINPQYIIDPNDKFDLMRIERSKTNPSHWWTKGDAVFSHFQQEMMEVLKNYMGIDVWFSGRGVTNKDYWEEEKERNKLRESIKRILKEKI